jgi:hypothetical protein
MAGQKRARQNVKSKNGRLSSKKRIDEVTGSQGKAVNTL